MAARRRTSLGTKSLATSGIRVSEWRVQRMAAKGIHSVAPSRWRTHRRAAPRVANSAFGCRGTLAFQVADSACCYRTGAYGRDLGGVISAESPVRVADSARCQREGLSPLPSGGRTQRAFIPYGPAPGPPGGGFSVRCFAGLSSLLSGWRIQRDAVRLVERVR